VFIGGGVRKKNVTKFKEFHRLSSILQLPYQPRNKIHFSLGAADLQVVILGEKQVGYTHPNKIYGSMFIGKPIAYIGPKESHITDIMKNCSGNIQVQHGEIDQLVSQLQSFAQKNILERAGVGNLNKSYAQTHFHPDQLKKQMTQVLTQIT
jgi:colanic acid biosynthesis glycosyl transferase WcaI